jgi:hypothetical protein
LAIPVVLALPGVGHPPMVLTAAMAATVPVVLVQAVAAVVVREDHTESDKQVALALHRRCLVPVVAAITAGQAGNPPPVLWESTARSGILSMAVAVVVLVPTAALVAVVAEVVSTAAAAVAALLLPVARVPLRETVALP